MKLSTKQKEVKILEVFKDNGVKHTCYATLNYSIGCDSKFFEGDNELGIKPLMQAKKWAKNNGYSHLKIVSMTIKKSDKIIEL